MDEKISIRECVEQGQFERAMELATCRVAENELDGRAWEWLGILRFRRNAGDVVGKARTAGVCV